MKRSPISILYALFIAVLFLLVKGYYFNTDDQAEHLPQVYQMLDTDLYAHDYFVPYSNSVFTVRYYFEHLMLAGNALMSLEWFCFLLTVFCIALLVRSVMGIAEEIFPRSAAKWIAPFLLLFVFYGFTVGGNHITYPSLISSTLAKSAGAFALWKFMQKRFLLAGIVLGVGSLFQPLVGLQLALLISGAYLFSQKGRIKNLIMFNLPFLLLISLVLVPVLSRQAEQNVLETAFYWEIFYRFRNYHHYLPSLFPTKDFIKFIIFLTLSVGSLMLFRPKRWKFILFIFGFSVLGMVVYSLLLEGNVVPAIGKTQWFKTSVWLELMGSVVLAGLLAQLPSVSHVLNKMASSKIIWLAGCGIGLFVLTNSALFPVLSKPYIIGNYHRTDLQKMHEWINQNTPKDVVVLVPPDDNSFSCEAKRSVPIHFVAIVHEPKFMLNWYKLYTRIYKVEMDDVGQLNPKEAAVKSYHQFNYKGGEPKINLRLDNLSSCEFANNLGPIVHKEGTWILTEFVASN